MTEEPTGDLEPLAEDLRDFLDAERELDVPHRDVHDRLYARIAPLLVAPPGAGPDANPADAATGTVVKAGLGAKLLVPAICTMLGAAGGAATHAYLAAQRSPAPVERNVVSAAAPPLPSASAPASLASADPVTPVPAVSASSRATPEPAAPASLRAERLLLESATAALMRGDDASASASLKKHAQQYPRGALAEEREVLWVKVLRAQGNDKAAEQRARDFKRKFPTSLQQGAVEKPGGSK
jgi:TolA-binding protein